MFLLLRLGLCHTLENSITLLYEYVPFKGLRLRLIVVSGVTLQSWGLSIFLKHQHGLWSLGFQICISGILERGEDKGESKAAWKRDREGMHFCPSFLKRPHNPPSYIHWPNCNCLNLKCSLWAHVFDTCSWLVMIFDTFRKLSDCGWRRLCSDTRLCTCSTDHALQD